jgi:hypothetical protein
MSSVMEEFFNLIMKNSINNYEKERENIINIICDTLKKMFLSCLVSEKNENVNQVYTIKKDIVEGYNDTINKPNVNEKNKFEYSSEVNEKITNYGKKIENMFDDVLEKVEKSINIDIENERKFIEEKNSYIINDYNSFLLKSKKIIKAIEEKKIEGFVITTKNNGKIGLYKNKSTFEVYLDLKFESYQNQNQDCIFCSFCKNRTWLKSYKKNKLSHNEGLGNSQMIYNYFNSSVNPKAMAFENTYGNSVISNVEERILVVPYNHIKTMGEHESCGPGSKTFPNNGSFDQNRGIYVCGASVYDNSKDDEVISYLIDMMNCALLYAKNKYGKEHKLADIDYDNHDGLFYKFKNPEKDPKDNNYGSLYLLFHCNENSVPHLHMHTYISSQDHLYNTLDAGRYVNNKKKIFLAERDSSEIYGSPDFARYENTEKLIIAKGKRIRDESNLDSINYTEKKFWFDENGNKSDLSMFHSCSFEHFFKKVIGIEDGSELMRTKFIFPVFNHDNQPPLLEQLKKHSYVNEYNNIIKNSYKDTCNVSFIDQNFNKNFKKNKYNEIFIKNIDLPKNEIEKRYVIDYVKNDFGISDSVNIFHKNILNKTEILKLFLNICCDNSNIGGIYNHAYPNFEEGTISYPDIILFDPSIHGLKIAIDAPYTTCYYDKNEIYVIPKMIVFTLYLTYIQQYKQRYKLGDESRSLINIIEDFIYNKERKNEKDDKFIDAMKNLRGGNLSDVDIAEKINVKDFLKNVNYVYGDYTKKIFKYEYENMDAVIKEYNTLTTKYKLSSDNELFMAKQILTCLYYRIVPSLYQIDSLNEYN